MHKPHSLVPAIILTAVFAMGDPDYSAAAPFDSAGLQYQVVKFEKSHGPTGSVPCCAKLSAEFPEFVGGAPPDALDAINAFVRYFLPVSSERRPGYTLDEMANRLLSFWRRMKSVEPDMGLGMGETFTVTVTYNQKGILCLKFYWWSSGGAHPIDRTSFVNFDVVGGNQLKLTDLFAEGYKPRLDSIGEIEFRSTRNMAPDSSLAAAGYRFKEGRFTLNENFAIDSAGLLFHFNDYEIMPHGAAPEVTLSFDALAGLLPRGGRLAKLAEGRK